MQGLIHRPLVHVALFALLLALLPAFFPNPFYYDVAIKIGINAFVCVGLNLLAGYTGQISLGHAAFFGLGAYGTAIISARLGLNGLLSAALTAGILGLFALLIATPILRLRGHYLAMATLGLGIIIFITLNREAGWTGGPDGMDAPALSLFGQKITSPKIWYAVVMTCLVGAIFASGSLIASPAGRALKAVHGSETAASTLGIEVAQLKARIFALSAVFASLGGSLFAFTERFITPGEAGFLHSVEFITMIVLGGLSSIFGGVVGAALLTALPQAIADLQDYKNIVLGLILVSIMIFMPRGIVPTMTALFGRSRAARSAA